MTEFTCNNELYRRGDACFRLSSLVTMNFRIYRRKVHESWVNFHDILVLKFMNFKLCFFGSPGQRGGLKFMNFSVRELQRAREPLFRSATFRFSSLQRSSAGMRETIPAEDISSSLLCCRSQGNASSRCFLTTVTTTAGSCTGQQFTVTCRSEKFMNFKLL